MAGKGAEAGAGGTGPEIQLEYTPTWIVASVCAVIIIISLIFERLLHRLGKRLKKKHQKPLFEALQKVKEELMLLGFISLMLTVFQDLTQKICVEQSVMMHWLPCERKPPVTTARFAGVVDGARRLLAGGGSSDYCEKKGKVPILSFQAIHNLHIFIFILAVTHVVLTATTVLLGVAQMRKWKSWEGNIHVNDDTAPKMINRVQQFAFIKNHYKGRGIRWRIFGWMRSFFKQFSGSVTEEDYATMRLGFIMKHCRGNPKLNFYKYMIRALEADFKKVVGIKWYLWAFLVLCLMLNVHGWHVYLWISLVQFILLIAVGSKMEHIITELALEVVEKHSAIEGELVVTPSDKLFWFNRPKLVLVFIHFVLFQNAFEIAFFLWLWVTHGFESCIMGKPGFVIPRVVISVIGQFICGYSTLPLYAIVSNMGASFKKAIFDENVTEGIVHWVQNARRRKGISAAAAAATTTRMTTDGSNSPYAGAIQMTNAQRDTAIEQGTARLM